MYSLLCGVMLLSAGAAAAQEQFPFAKSIKTLDLAATGAAAEFEQLVIQAATTPLIYIDWQFANFTGNEVFEGLKPEGTGDDPDAAACQQIADGDEQFTVSGRPNGENNHLLAVFDLWPSGMDAFTAATCEYFASDPGDGLRIRGFYYVADVRIATAEKYNFRPLEIGASTIPRDFFASGR
jgi:hypothetical protein